MIGKIINMLKTVILSIFKKKELDYNTWIFSSSFNTKYNYNSKYLFEYVLKNKPEIDPIFVINDDELRGKLQEQYGKHYFIETNSIGGIKKVLGSGVWLTSAGLPVYGFNLNRNRMIINLWHGVPLKKIVLMENGVGSFKKLYFKFIFSSNYTHILTTSKNLTTIMADSFGVPKEIVHVWGQPRNDQLFINDKSLTLKDLYKELPTFEKVILYAPTYRDDNKTIFFPFKDFDRRELDMFLEKNKYLILIRCHQSELQSTSDIIGDRVRLINEDKIEDIMEVLNQFDLLITDYSSIYIDYLLTEKPILFLPYDKEQYLANRGMNFEYDSVTPGPKPDTFEHFKIEILNLLGDEKYYKLQIQNCNQFFNEIKKPCSEVVYKNILEEIQLRHLL